MKLHPWLAQDSEKLEEGIQWELAKLRTWLLPHPQADPVDQQHVHHSTWCPVPAFRDEGPPLHLHLLNLTQVSLVAECDLETPSKGIPGNTVPADPCGYTTQLPGVAGLFFFCILQIRERSWGVVL